MEPSGKFLYVANRNSSAVSVFTVNETTGALASTDSTFATGLSPVDITVDPAGKFLYTANYSSSSSNSISAFTINKTSGALTDVSGSPFAIGTRPESVTVDGSGKFLYVANPQFNHVSCFIIDATNGALTAQISSPFLAGSSPISVATTR